MRNKPILFLIIFLLTSFSAWSDSTLLKSLDSPHQGLFQGDPDFTKLNPAVAEDKLFKLAPSPSAKQLILESTEANNHRYYSQYQILPLKTQGNRTYYQTLETLNAPSRFQPKLFKKNVAVNGQGISYGGIYWPLEKMVITVQGNLIYYNKIAIIKMEPLSGQLFPLNVGNQLRFKFTRLHERLFNNQRTFTIEHGIMEYSVIEKHKNSSTQKGQSIPGDVYTINVSESTDLHPKLYLTDRYDYSPALGWYVNDHYYDVNNQPTANYLIQNWK